MAAHKRPIPVRHCTCASRATYEVFSTRNASHGYYCSRCADKEVQRLQESKRSGE